ncbi:MAG: ATP-dependent helicase HrpB [Syntrophaceae bacterium]
MTHLPIKAILPDLKAVLNNGRNAVVQAPPGAGKTTCVPLALMDEAWLEGRTILMLEPRRLATRAAAGRMAEMLDEPVGRTVGYRIRLDSKVGPQTRIEVLTEGILTRRIQNDPGLEGVGLVIFDEFHERSLHADLGLALCLDTQAALRQDLRIVVMSATLEINSVAELLGQAPVLSAVGRAYPIETRYRPLKRTHVRDGAVAVPVRDVAQAVHAALGEHPGNILVFLPGAPEIRRLEGLLAESGLGPDIIVAPLYGMLPREAQDRAIDAPPTDKRKVVLSSALAETSLTIEGVTVVIDSGFMRVPHYDPRSALTRLETLKVSRASADQRRGRAGRTAPGFCYRLWRVEEDAHLAPFSEPEIRNADMAPLALELAQWGVSDPMTLAWLDPPPTAAFNQARAMLEELDAIDNQGRITETGRRMAGFGLHPRLAHMLIACEPLGLGRLACEIAALLSERDILRGGASSGPADMRARLEILHGLEGKARHGRQGAGVDTVLARRVLDLAHNLEKTLAHPDTERQTGDTTDQAGLVLAFAYPDRIARRRTGSQGKYLLSGGRGARLPVTDLLAGEEFIVVAEMDGDPREARIFLAAPLELVAIERHFSRRIITEDSSGWDDCVQAVTAYRRRRLGQVVLREEALPQPDQAIMLQGILEGIRKGGLEVLPWSKAARTLRERIAFLARMAPRTGPWPDMSDAGLLDRLEQWLTPYLEGMQRLKDLQALDLVAVLLHQLDWEKQRRLDELAPTHIRVPSGSCIPLDYESGNDPVLAVRLQEMFGCTATPTVAGGIAVVLQLLSPAGRPIQVTRDLANFWRTTYTEVRKDLRGRYPRHYWPENPFEAQATNRAKPRKGKSF